MTPCQRALPLDRAGEAQPLDPHIGSRSRPHQTTGATTDFRYRLIQAFGWPRWLIMDALWNRAGHYIFALWFLLSFFFSSPNLSGRKLDVYHTSTHGVALVRIYGAGLKCAASGSLEIQDAKMAQKSPSRHHRTTMLGRIFAKAYIDNRKNCLSSNISSTCPRNMVNFGPLTAEIGSGVWGTPANFNGFRVLAALLPGTLVVGVSQTLRR